MKPKHCEVIDCKRKVFILCGCIFLCRFHWDNPFAEYL